MNNYFFDLNPLDEIETILYPFLSIISNELNISHKHPIPLTEKGSLFLTDPSFWIIYIRVKVLYAEKEKKKSVFIKQFNYATKYDIFNRNVLYDFFLLTLKIFFDTEKLKCIIASKKKLTTINEIDDKDYMCLLKNKEYFLKEQKKLNVIVKNEIPLNSLGNQLYKEIVKTNLRENIVQSVYQIEFLSKCSNIRNFSKEKLEVGKGVNWKFLTKKTKFKRG